MLGALKKVVTSSTTRQQLRAAIVVKTCALAALDAARAATARAKASLTAADEAEARVARAHASAKQASREWAARGALETDSAHLCAVAAAAEVERYAAAARLLAQGASAAIPQLQQAEMDAASEVRAAEAAVRAAIGPILLEYAAPHFERLGRAAGEVRSAIIGLCTPVAELRAIQRAGEECGPVGIHGMNNALPHARFAAMVDQLIELEQMIACLRSDAPPKPATNWWDFVERAQRDADARNIEYTERR